MKCVKCSAKATVHIGNLDACRACFQKIIQKRVRKEIRLKKLIEKNDMLLILDDGSAAAKLFGYLLKEIIHGMPISVKTKKMQYSVGMEIKGNFNKIIIPWNADKEGEYLLSCFFEKKKPMFLSHFKLKGKLYAKPLIHATQEETEEFCRIRKIKFIKSKRKSPAAEMISELQKNYPEIAFGLVRSSEELRKII